MRRRWPLPLPEAPTPASLPRLLEALLPAGPGFDALCRHGGRQISAMHSIADGLGALQRRAGRPGPAWGARRQPGLQPPAALQLAAPQLAPARGLAEAALRHEPEHWAGGASPAAAAAAPQPARPAPPPAPSSFVQGTVDRVVFPKDNGGAPGYKVIKVGGGGAGRCAPHAGAAARQPGVRQVRALELGGKPDGVRASPPPPARAQSALDQHRAQRQLQHDAAKGIEVVAGNFPPVRVGQRFCFHGAWVDSDKWGLQLRGSSCEQLELTHEPDLVHYLKSGASCCARRPAGGQPEPALTRGAARRSQASGGRQGPRRGHRAGLWGQDAEHPQQPVRGRSPDWRGGLQQGQRAEDQGQVGRRAGGPHCAAP